jgi:rod shape-determining protein MreB
MLGGRDIAIDLGTANTLVYVRGEGVVLSEPSVVATDQRTGEVHAVGAEAERMIGRTPASISAIRPLRHGVIADFETTEEMLRYFIGRVHRSRFAHPRVVMCAPSGVTDVERRAVEEACLGAGARQMHLIEEPVAAAIGAGLDIAEPTGRLVVDIGGGTSEVAVISLGGIVVSESLRVGGYELTDAIATHVRRTHDVAIGEATAEAVKLDIGSARPTSGEGAGEGEAQVRGRHLSSGLPVTVTLTAAEVRAALADLVQAIIDAVRATLEATPPELSSDVINGGILLAGGGSLLQGFAERLSEETGIPAVLAESPLTCVVIGSGLSLEEFDTLAHGGGGARRRRSWWR